MNEKNLTEFSEHSDSENEKTDTKNGVKAVGSRRRKRDMKQKMKMLLSLPCTDDDRENLEAMGIPTEDMDNETVLLVAMFFKAADGDTRAFEKVMQILGKDIAHEKLELKKRELKLKEAAANSGSEALNKLDDVLDKIRGDL